MDNEVLDLIRQNEQKVHRRVRQRFTSNLIIAHLNRYVLPKVRVRIEYYKNIEMKQSQLTLQNYQYGLANKDMLMLNGKLNTMRDIIMRVQSMKSSEVLAGQLSNTEQNALRGYLSVPAADLRKNGTIAEVRVTELANLLNQCQVVLIEAADGKSIEFKLVF